MALQSDANYAAVILAGGEGIRLSALTREIFGYHLPKQFCPLFDGKTLLEQIMRRVSMLVPSAQTIIVLNRAHEFFYSALLDEMASRNLFVQPENRGTAPAILGALIRLIEAGGRGTVAIFPSDHYVSDDSVFMRHVSAAFRAVDYSPHLIVLLGITPEWAGNRIRMDRTGRARLARRTPYPDKSSTFVVSGKNLRPTLRGNYITAIASGTALYWWLMPRLSSR